MEFILDDFKSPQNIKSRAATGNLTVRASKVKRTRIECNGRNELVVCVGDNAGSLSLQGTYINIIYNTNNTIMVH